MPLARCSSIRDIHRRRHCLQHVASEEPPPLNGPVRREQHDATCRQVGLGTPSGLSPPLDWPVLESGDVYQFGVAGGASLHRLLAIYNRTTWGFDSFAGLPAAAASESTLVHRRNKALSWSAGAFRTRHQRAPAVPRHSDVRFVQGLFNETLTPTLAAERGLRPAVYLDIDVDRYESSLQALEWMFAHRLAVVGTVVGYDDWWTLPCAARDRRVFEHGEARAHAEISRRHGVRFRCVCGPCVAGVDRRTVGFRPYFVVEAVGASVPHTGFTMTDDEVASYLGLGGGGSPHDRRTPCGRIASEYTIIDRLVRRD